MTPYMPKNAYEVVKTREEFKDYLDRIEKIKPDENGNVLVDRSNMMTIAGKLRQGIVFMDCLLYTMSFNRGRE